MRHGDDAACVGAGRRTGVSYSKLAFHLISPCIFEGLNGSSCSFIHLFYTHSAAPHRG